MSKKHQKKQLERARAKRAAERAQQRGRNRLLLALGGGALLVVAIVGVWLLVNRDAPEDVAEDAVGDVAASPGDDALLFGSESDGTVTGSSETTPPVASEATPPATSDPSASSTAASNGFDPCPVPGPDAPEADTSLQFDAPPEPDRTGTVVATIETTCGTIVAELDADAAPQTVSSFAFLAEEDFYVGVPFHRVQGDFVIQGGDPTGTGSGGPGYSFADELDLAERVVADNDGTYPRGTLAMANSGPDTNGSQFFVVQADPGYPFPPDYAVFGTVTEGMDVVDRIANGPVSGPANDQAVDPTRILDVSVAEAS